MLITLFTNNPVLFCFLSLLIFFIISGVISAIFMGDDESGEAAGLAFLMPALLAFVGIKWLEWGIKKKMYESDPFGIIPEPPDEPDNLV